MRIFLWTVTLLFSASALGQQSVEIKKVRAYLEKEKSCALAFGSIHPIFPGKDKSNPNVASFVNCIADVNRGSGVNQVSGCAFLRFDTVAENYISMKGLATKDLFVEGKPCTWEVAKSLLEMNVFPKGSGTGPTPGDFLFYGAKSDRLPMILFSNFKEATSWFDKKKESWLAEQKGSK